MCLLNTLPNQFQTIPQPQQTGNTAETLLRRCPRQGREYTHLSKQASLLPCLEIEPGESQKGQLPRAGFSSTTSAVFSEQLQHIGKTGFTGSYWQASLKIPPPESPCIRGKAGFN